MITQQNIEEYILDYIDGELSPTEEAEMKDYIDQHPEYADMLAEYSEFKIEKVPHLFPLKTDLLHQEKKSIALWKPVSAAAAIVLILVSVYLFVARLQSYDVSNTKSPIPVANSQGIAPVDTLVQSSAANDEEASNAKAVNKRNAIHQQLVTSPQSSRQISPNKTSNKSEPSQLGTNPKSRPEQVAKLDPKRELMLAQDEVADLDNKFLSTDMQLAHNAKREDRSIVSFKIRDSEPLKEGVSAFQKIINSYNKIRKDSNNYIVTINLNRMFN